jgi:hypothetical protein
MRTQTFSIVVPFAGIALLLGLFWADRRWRIWRAGWRIETEVLEPLGKVEAAYERGKLVSYRLRKHGVLIEIMCADPETRSGGIEFARSVSKEHLDRYLRDAVGCVPEADSKAFGFDKGTWNIQNITINGKDSMRFELGNSADRDHVAVVFLENGQYLFEAVDG